MAEQVILFNPNEIVQTIRHIQTLEFVEKQIPKDDPVKESFRTALKENRVVLAYMIPRQIKAQVQPTPPIKKKKKKGSK